mmetsp:Transcript_21257/g.68837  ORF Transcript_21257/g.68837 Transcript_21257/m.68837 type:complete len:232 (-) Transcript_21257:443-1138(-)
MTSAVMSSRERCLRSRSRSAQRHVWSAASEGLARPLSTTSAKQRCSLGTTSQTPSLATTTREPGGKTKSWTLGSEMTARAAPGSPSERVNMVDCPFAAKRRASAWSPSPANSPTKLTREHSTHACASVVAVSADEAADDGGGEDMMVARRTCSRKWMSGTATGVERCGVGGAAGVKCHSSSSKSMGTTLGAASSASSEKALSARDATSRSCTTTASSSASSSRGCESSTSR